MKYRIKLRSDLFARLLVGTVGLGLALTACDDSEDRIDDEGSQAGSGGSKTGGTSGTGGSVTGGSGGTGENGGAGGDPIVGGAGSGPVAGAGGEPSGQAGGGAGGEAGSGGEGGQGGGPGDDTQVVFGDDYAPGITFAPFGGSVNLLAVDTTTAHSGTASLKIAVPTGNTYTGGALVSAIDQDLSAYNAVSFWAKASVAHALNGAGLGNDASASKPFELERNALALTTEWQRFVLPIPSPSKLVAENGLFHFAEGAEAAAYTIWLDDIEYITVDDRPAPTSTARTPVTLNVTAGNTLALPFATAVYTLDTVAVPFVVGPAWFDYVAIDEAVASVSGGVLTGEGAGTTTISSELDGVDTTGIFTVNVTEVVLPPTVGASVPALLPANVISLFSDTYTNAPVTTWDTDWGSANVADVLIAGNATKVYTALNFAGVDFTNQIDATLMTHLHFDVWLPAATVFKVKLVDFGPNGIYQSPQNIPSDDTEFEVVKTGLTTKTWQSVEFALADFTGLAARAHLAQMVIASEANSTVYFDNVYFHN